MSDKQRVLFLCTGNSARSQMAEALLRHLAGDRYEVTSAGTRPVGVHPSAVGVLAESGIDASGHRSKAVDTLSSEDFDLVITVCDHAREQCPVFPGAAMLHWSFEDPAAEHGPGQFEKFREVRDAIRRRIEAFIGGESLGSA